MKESDIVNLISSDKQMMAILKTTRALQLPDWWIGAGFIRSKVWDYLHGYTTPTPLPDIDVIYFDPTDFKPEQAGDDSIPPETRYEKQLQKTHPDIHWSVTNQARMHIFHNRHPYSNAIEAVADWSETATCIAVTLTENDELLLAAPYGITDLTQLIIRPIPDYQKKYKHDPDLFSRRIEQKQWLIKWPKLRIITT